MSKSSFFCASCGAPLEMTLREGKHNCPYCGSKISNLEYVQNDRSSTKKREMTAEERKRYIDREYLHYLRQHRGSQYVQSRKSFELNFKLMDLAGGRLVTFTDDSIGPLTRYEEDEIQEILAEVRRLREADFLEEERLLLERRRREEEARRRASWLDIDIDEDTDPAGGGKK